MGERFEQLHGELSREASNLRHSISFTTKTAHMVGSAITELSQTHADGKGKNWRLIFTRFVVRKQCEQIQVRLHLSANYAAYCGETQRRSIMSRGGSVEAARQAAVEAAAAAAVAVAP